MELTTDDIAALYQLAMQAQIPAGQAVRVAILFQKIEAVIARGQAEPHIQAALQAVKSNPVGGKPPAG